MKNLVFIFIVFSVHTAAWAEWIKLAEHKRGNTFYVDPSTLRVEGGHRIVAELIDYKRPDVSGDRSVRVQREYDCDGVRYQVQSASYYKASMASGEPSSSTTGTMGWTDIDANTPARTVLDYVCATK